jgi:hypothetical protein
MKRTFLVPVVVGAILMGVFVNTAECAGSFGAGIHYLRTLGDIKDVPGWDKNALGFIGSYQLGLGLIKVEGDLEWVPDYGGSDKSLIEPQVYGLLGTLLYGGIGFGWSYFNDGWLDNPFYALRVGAALGVGVIGVDVFATYRFQTSKVFKNFDNDDLNSITFGAIVRF